jgi:mevalonate kinase
MPGGEVDERGLASSAAFAVQTAKQIFKGHIALAFDEKLYGIANRAALAMQAMQLARSRTQASQIVGPVYESGEGASSIVG